MKRFFDVTLAGLGLVLLLPLFAVIGLFIALLSGRPVIFRQERVGRNGVPFQLLKFRTMKNVSGAGGRLITSSGDPRITPVGRILRPMKLDELPQLFNVVRGEMSLVGPRPEVARYVALYPRSVATKVLSLRPGVTDEASIVFRDEGDILALADDPERVYVEQILPRKLELYERYVDQHSLVGDVLIIIRTILCLVPGCKSCASRPRRS